MLEISLRLVEFMDADAVDQCPLSVTARVAPRFEEPILPPDEDDSVPVPAAAGQPGGGGSSATALRPRFSRALNITQQGRSATDGTATFSFDLVQAFEQVARDNPGAADVKAFLRIDVACAGINRQLNLIEFPLDPNERFETIILFDFAKAIVGHTTANSALLWFQQHGELSADQQHTCEIRRVEPGATETLLQSRAVRLDPNQENTAAISITGLESDTQYRYALKLRERQTDDVTRERIIARGEFLTHSGRTDQLTFAFGSCHQPTASPDVEGVITPLDALNRWQALARRKDYEILLLIGDQIYGDEIEKVWKSATWRQRYVNRYNQFWDYWPMREVLRRTPTYMTPDDHDNDDDWGTVAIDADQTAAALETYRIFQHAHNPPTQGGRLHYHFRRGPAAFFVMDSRSERGKNAAHPVMGQRQFDDFRAWAESDEARQADVIFFIAPVPIALVPEKTIEEWLEKFEPVVVAAGTGAGALVGAGLGWVIAGPPGAAAGAKVGAIAGGVGTAIAYEVKEHELPTAVDLADQWTTLENQVELRLVLDILFDLANDIRGGRPGPRPRAIFILAGDAHSGWIHLLRSNSAAGEHNHSRNPFMYQLLSSSISRPPMVSGKNADLVKRTVGGPRAITQADLVQASFSSSMPVSPRKFILDTEHGRHYASEFLGVLLERTFGRIDVEWIGPGRRYRFNLFIEGQQGRLIQRMELNLDAAQVLPEPIRPPLWLEPVLNVMMR